MTATVAYRVACRRVARDFPNEKALEKYLHDHPQADKHKHHVVDHEDMGHGEKEHGAGHDDHGHGHGGMFSGLKGALKAVAKQFKSAPKDVQKFISDPEHRKAALKKGKEGIKNAPGSYWDQLVKVSKHEVKEFKTAGQGIVAVMSGKKASKEQKHAMKQVAVHMGITIAAAALTTATPALAAMAAGKALGKHIALKAATEALGDLHVLQELGHIGHGAHHPVVHALAHLLKHAQHLKLAEDQEDNGGKEAAPEQLFAALVAKHVADEVENLDDDTLAEGLGGGDEKDDDVSDENQQKQAARVAATYLAQLVRANRRKTARPMMTPWGGEDHAWPAVPLIWDEEGVQRDRFNDVFVMRYVNYGQAGTPSLTVDTTPWTHGNKPEFTYKIEVFGEKLDSGKFPVDDYERKIPDLLKLALAAAEREIAKYAKELETLKVPNWEIWYDKSADDLVVEYKAPGRNPYSDSSMSGSFYSPLKVFTGEKSDYDIHYSKGADYEGHFGVRELHGEVRSLEDIKKVLKDAERLWAKAEKAAA